MDRFDQLLNELVALRKEIDGAEQRFSQVKTELRALYEGRPIHAEDVKALLPPAAPSPRTIAKKATPKTKASKAPREPKKSTGGKKGNALADRVQSMIDASPQQTFDAKGLAQTLGIKGKLKKLNSALSALYVAKRVSRVKPGVYRSLTS
jgi:hypothetical protein